MADMMVLVSKGEFEKAHKAAKLGDKLAIDAYNSAAKALSAVEGGAMFLVTVRPPDEGFWLVAVLEKPEFDGERWTAKKNVTPITDLGSLRALLKFANGKGVPTEAGKLGMSLQTPRVLTDEDVALLRKATGGTKPVVEKKKPEPEKKPAKVIEAPPIPAASGDLGEAKAALERGDRRAALEALLEAWRGCRAPEIESVIAVLSADLARAYEPIEAPAKEFDPRWSARAAKKDVADLPHLLEGFTHDPRGSMPLRLRALLDLPPDPRAAEKFLEIIEEPPITASSNFSFWTTLFGVLPKYLDTRATKRLQARARKKGGDSQFWPKLTGWIEKAIPLLPEPASADAKLLEAMRKQAEKAASSGVVEKPKESAPVVVAQSGDPLADAEASLVAKRPDDALEALLRFWGDRRNPEVAALIEKLGAAIDTTLPTLVAGKPAEIHAAWLAVGREPKASDVGRLLDALIAGKLADADERLSAVVQWAPDPRVGKHLALYFNDWKLGSRPTFWKLVYDAFVQHADPRQREMMIQRAEEFEGRAAFDRNRSERQQLRRIREPFVEACDRRHGEVSPAESAALGRIAKALDAWLAARDASASGAAQKERAFVQAIVDAWDDDEPRSVYADMLSEAGDPRGEYLSMALADAAGQAKLKSKLAEFEKKQKVALLGPLAPVVYKASWQRGLLHDVQLDSRGADWTDKATRDRILGDLRWCTVRRLSFFGTARNLIETVLGQAPLWALERIDDVDLTVLVQLLEREPMKHLKIVSWGYNGLGVNDEEGERIDAVAPPELWDRLVRAMPPSLEHFVFSGHDAPPRRLFELPRLRRVSAGSTNMGGVPDLRVWLERLVGTAFAGHVTVSCWLFDLEWTPEKTARLRLHRALEKNFADEVQMLTSAFDGLDVARIEWSSEHGGPLLGTLAKALAGLGAVRV